jgi:hypothetical protein
MAGCAIVSSSTLADAPIQLSQTRRFRTEPPSSGILDEPSSKIVPDTQPSTLDGGKIVARTELSDAEELDLGASRSEQSNEEGWSSLARSSLPDMVLAEGPRLDEANDLLVSKHLAPGLHRGKRLVVEKRRPALARGVDF